jgi:hypothetical protein
VSRYASANAVTLTTPDERDVGRNDQAAGEMPAGLIDEQRGVRARRDLGGDFG